jgi:pimeloyl-ACP methyl ester carboxylesterase
VSTAESLPRRRPQGQPVAVGGGRGAASSHREARVRVDGRRVEVLAMGTGTDRPLVFLHGWGMSPRAYLPGLSSIAERAGREVLALSLPGFGGTDPLPLARQGIAGMAAHLTTAIETLVHDGPVDLAGHSMGAGIALRIGATRPDLVRSLTLLCPVGGAGLGPAPLHRLLGGVTLDGFHRWTPRALADLVPAVQRHPAAAVVAAVAAWRADLVHDVARVSDHRIRCVLSFADQDTVVVPGDIPRLGSPYVRCETVSGRHSWMLTDPCRFADTILAHLGHAALPAAA